MAVTGPGPRNQPHPCSSSSFPKGHPSIPVGLESHQVHILKRSLQCLKRLLGPTEGTVIQIPTLPNRVSVGALLFLSEPQCCLLCWGGGEMAVALVEMMQDGSQRPCPAPAPCLVATVMATPVSDTQFSCPSCVNGVLSSLYRGGHSSLREGQGLACLATVL